MTETAQDTIPAFRITAEEARAARDAGALLVDVRGLSGRVRDGEVGGAVILAKADAVDALTRRLALREPGQKTVIFCSSVRGSTPVVEALIAAGLSQVYEVDGGAPALISVTAS